MSPSMALTPYITFSASPDTFSSPSRLTTVTPSSRSMMRIFSSKEPKILTASSIRSMLIVCSIKLLRSSLLQPEEPCSSAGCVSFSCCPS